jgi:phospholipase C
MGQLNNIDHIVVLMLENRSFDNMFGKLYPKSATFDGLTGTESNPDTNGVPVQVWQNTGTDETTMTIPDPDPGELWTDINTQLFATPNVGSPAPVPTMDGFVKNYVGQTAEPPQNYIGKNIMHYFTVDQVPVISTLAQQFAVCDRWYASAPCQTWPNRWFVHAATAAGHENNQPIHLPNIETIYDRFELAGTEDWKIYFHDVPQAFTLMRLWLLGDHFQFYRQFQVDCQTGQLPAYSFIEPRYFSDFGSSENDEHPPSVVTLGERLIADVYNCIRSSPLWTKTLLIITYDEHGGGYDHAPPPPAAEPEPPGQGQVFNFDRYGVRVPAVLVSPYIQQGTIFRSPGAVPCDHTSIIATLRKRFPALGAALTGRDAVAPDLDGVLTLPTPSNDGPASIKALPFATSTQAAAVAQTKPLNGMQKALVDLAANLPEAPGKNLESHITGLRAGLRQPPLGTTDNVHAAASYVKKQVGNFFQAR